MLDGSGDMLLKRYYRLKRYLRFLGILVKNILSKVLSMRDTNKK